MNGMVTSSIPNYSTHFSLCCHKKASFFWKEPHGLTFEWWTSLASNVPAPKPPFLFTINPIFMWTNTYSTYLVGKTISTIVYIRLTEGTHTAYIAPVHEDSIFVSFPLPNNSHQFWMALPGLQVIRSAGINNHFKWTGWMFPLSDL